MIAFLNGPLFTLILFPLIGTFLVAAAIRYLGGSRTNDRLVSVSASIGVIWVCALVIGVPDLPPLRDGSAMPVLLLGGLVIGSLLDQFLPTLKDRARLLELFLDLVFAFAIISWAMGKLDIWTVAVFVAWGVILTRTRRFSKSSALPATMVMLSAAGLTLVAWIGDSLIDRNLALGTLFTTMGMSVWLLLIRSLPLGYGFQWGAFSALLLISLRILETNPAMAAAISVLGFIFFSDSAAVSLTTWKPGLGKVPFPLLIIALSTLPVILSVAISLSVAEFFA